MSDVAVTQPHQTCPQCQALLPVDAGFCPECGTATNTSVPEQASLPTFGGMQTMLPTDGEGNLNLNVLKPGVQFAGRYQIEEQIGIGGMGLVYKAHDKVADQTVALKLLHPERSGSGSSNRLKKEGLTARNIRQKNVVAIYDIGDSDGQPFISMEYLEGKSLRQWQREHQRTGQPIPSYLVFQVIEQILRGLQAAHEAGVVHRDLKPENVMVVSENENEVIVKILDFGIARFGPSEPEASGAMGTRGYMAPEQLTNPDFAKPSADLYSTSAMFYELLADVVPHGHWQPPSSGRHDVPPGIDQLIERGLSSRPLNRVQTATEYLSELNRLTGHLQVLADIVTPGGRDSGQVTHSPSKSGTQVVIVIGVLVAVMFAGLMMFGIIAAAIVDESSNSENEYQPYYEQPIDGYVPSQYPSQPFNSNWNY